MMFVQADAVRLPFADGAFDLVLGSSPYQGQRCYGINASRGCREWASWFLHVTKEALRVSSGPVVWVVDDPVRGHRLWPGTALFRSMAFDAGLIEERPLIWRANKAPTRKGAWWSHCWEYLLCFKREAAPLPYFDWKATAAPPKYGYSGAFRQRRTNGERPKRLLPYKSPELSSPRDVLYAKVGGGHMGHALACRNEAPFPEALVKQVIPVLVPKSGRVLDPFSGSGTTVAAATALGRIGVGCDLRFSQCELGRRRCAEVQMELI